MKPAITKTKKPAIPAAIERAIAREIDEHKAEKAALIAEQAALIAEKAALQAAFDERTAQYEKERAKRELQLAAFKKQPEIEQQPEPAAAAVQDTPELEITEPAAAAVQDTPSATFGFASIAALLPSTRLFPRPP